MLAKRPKAVVISGILRRAAEEDQRAAARRQAAEAVRLGEHLPRQRGGDQRQRAQQPEGLCYLYVHIQYESRELSSAWKNTKTQSFTSITSSKPSDQQVEKILVWFKNEALMSLVLVDSFLISI